MDLAVVVNCSLSIQSTIMAPTVALPAGDMLFFRCYIGKKDEETKDGKTS